MVNVRSHFVRPYIKILAFWLIYAFSQFDLLISYKNVHEEDRLHRDDSAIYG